MTNAVAVKSADAQPPTDARSSVHPIPSVASRARLAEILAACAALRVAVIGDFSLDAYWYADMTRSELSREAPLFVRPVVRETYSPGGAANAAWNAAALGVGEVYALTVLGDDWRGALLRQVLEREGVRLDHTLFRPDCVTPMYGKVMLTAHGVQQEDARIDFINPCALTGEIEDALIAATAALLPRLDALIVADYNTQGMITPRVRAALNRLAVEHPRVVFVVDSRTRIAAFEGMVLKPNDIEAAAVLFPGEPAGAVTLERLAEAGRGWQRSNGKPIYITIGPRGCLVLWEGGAAHLPGVPVPPPIDTVGAGDTFISALASSLAAGASPAEAGAVANLAAAVTVAKLHITGTASPAEIVALYNARDS
jgi:rfaE bifunctional protein kinase chain/domain